MPQTRQHIIDLLGSIGREPNRKLGQHFMIEPPLVERLVAEGGLADNPLVLEVGPGTGALTEPLLEAGVEVVAVELDEALADLLADEIGGRYKFPGRLHIVRGDVLEGKHHLNDEMLDTLAKIANGRPTRLIANLPYNIASPLLAELADLTWKASRDPHGGVAFDRFVFTVQREVAERLTAPADTKEYGPLSVLCQGLGVVTSVVHKISPNAFYPKPNVFSAMLRIDLPADRLAAVSDLEAMHRWLEVGFGHRRKTLSASIRFAPPDWQVRLTTAAVASGVDLTRRGETLTVAEYLELARQT
ncbi:MAG: 16S rRNA (adenine(1518)-N(6)/adenine(1519)-N(6))-dimethyltransferase RsmA [Phycisphaerae bacterium]|nr:16S rRNA (adenine(1518)-N(6)/adenine(1519)-N(6))-dimethyltransferase RsmA [Phycisphaerae bacterium]